MAKKTVFLLQDSKSVVEELTKLFVSDEQFEIIGYSTDGEQGLNFILERKPNIAIIGLVLSGLDGLAVLSKI